MKKISFSSHLFGTQRTRTGRGAGRVSDGVSGKSVVSMSNVLRITVLRASGLIAADSNGLSDPYVSLETTRSGTPPLSPKSDSFLACAALR